MVPFLYDSFFLLYRDYCDGYWKNLSRKKLAKTDSGKKLLKFNPKDIHIQKPADQVNVGSAAQLQTAEYKKAMSRESKVYTFRKKVAILFAITASHFMEKSPSKSPIVQ